MEKSERETLIRWNRADAEEGYFTFDTSWKPDFEKALRKIGGEGNAISIRKSTSPDGETSFQIKIPISYIGRDALASERGV